MAATKISGLVLDKINSLAGAITGVNSHQGRYRYQENDDPEQDLRNQTAETKAEAGWFVEERMAPAQSTLGNGVLTIRGTVAIKLLTQSSSSTDLLCDLMDEIFEAVMQEAEYESLGVRPTNGRWGRDADELENDIALFFISIEFQTGPIC